MAARGIRTEVLAAEIGVIRNQTFAKLRGASPWKASEVFSIAEFFGVRVQDLFDGLGLLG